MRELAQSRKLLVDTMQKRSSQLQHLKDKYWRVIGDGPIGDKAQELMDKTWAIQAAGFEPIPRTVLSMGFFEDFRKRAGIKNANSNDEIIERIFETNFNSREMETIFRLLGTFQLPIAIRSSAFGDSRGTGIYESEFYNGKRSFERLLKRVLAYEFCDSAIEYRRVEGLEPGMAIILEPVFGTWLGPTRLDSEEKQFGPLYGGVAHTNSAKGEATAIVCGGMPLFAVNGKGIPITEKTRNIRKGIEEQDRRLEEIIKNDGICPSLALALDGMFFDAHYDIPDQNGMPTSNTRGKKLSWLFDKLKKLEQLIGKPQYVEWAVLERKAKQHIAILQIADLNIETDFYELTDTEKVFIRSEYVVGKAKRECSAVVEIHAKGALDDLKRFNDENKDYLVIYPGVLTSYNAKMSFMHISNAAVLAERKYSMHDKRPEDHFGGLLEKTGKTLLVVRRADTLVEKLGKPVPDERYPNLTIYPVKTTTLANPRINKAIVKI